MMDGFIACNDQLGAIGHFLKQNAKTEGRVKTAIKHPITLLGRGPTVHSGVGLGEN